MNIRKSFFFLLLTAILASACEKAAEPEFIKIVSGVGAAMEIEPGGYARVDFKVNESIKYFMYNTPDGTDEISIETPGGGVPEHLYLKYVECISSHDNSFFANIGDDFKGRQYEESVVIVIQREGRRYVSAPINIKCGEPVCSGAPQTGLPVIYITTKGYAEIKSKEEYVDALINVDGNGKFDNVATMPCRIRGRGNTTWSYPKKPYLIKLDSKTPMLGMPKHKSWVLLANYIDKPMIRNAVAFKVASLTSIAYTTRSQFCEVVLNGEHIGNYQLVEHIKVDKNRLNISEKDGYLYELDGRYRNKVNWTDPHGSCDLVKSGIPFSIKYPDEDEITQKQIDRGKEIISEVAEAIYSEDFKDPGKGYRKLLDVESFADFWIVYELTINHELLNPLSIFMFKDGDKPLAAGPVWDFDWGILSFVENPQARDDIFLKDAIWYTQLFKDPYFVNVLKERWEALYPSLCTVPEFMDEKRAELEKSAEYNYQLWDPYVGKSRKVINGDERMPFDEAVELLKTNYNIHLETMDKAIKALTVEETL